VKDLSKRKLCQLSKKLEAAKVTFRTEVERLADQARTEILSYCQEHGLDFKAGNGSWCITRLDEEDGREILVDDDELPINIRALLMLEVAHADHLGFYLCDVERPPQKKDRTP
jgi:hypothetical protein